MRQRSQQVTNRVKFFLGIAITFLCLVFVLHQVKFHELKSSLELFNWESIFLGISCLAFGYTIRIYRWTFTLRQMNSKVTFRQCTTPFLGSIALNNLLPLRLGDGVRALIYPKKMKIGISVGVSSVALERMLDLAVLILFFSFGVLAVGSDGIPGYLFVASFTLIIVLILFMLFLIGIKQGRFSRLLRGVQLKSPKLVARIIDLGLDSFKDIGKLLKFKSIGKITFLSVLIWLFESGLFYFVLRGFGLPATLSIAMLITSIVSISTMVPSLPGYLGPFEAAAFISITLLGGSSLTGASFALIAHLALWLPTTVIGVFAIGTDYDFFKLARRETSTSTMETQK